MKKRIVSLLLSLIVLFSSAYAEVDDCTIYVDEEYYGSYLPVQSVYEIEEHMNFEKAKYCIPDGCHTMLGLGRDNRCYADVKFHDGYAIEKKYFDEYKFEYRGQDLYIIDDNGNEYKRISKEVNIYKAIDKYVMDKVCSCIKDLKNVEVYEDSICVDGKYNCSLGLDSNFIDTKDALMLLGGGLKTEGMSGGIYKLTDNAHLIGGYVSDEEFIHFPLLSYEPLIPLEDMSASELRLYRNLQFARHGYKFKSPDLQEVFGQFKWYKPKSSNNGIKLTKEEEAIVNKCLELEKHKKIPLPKNNIISLSEEEKTNYMVGVWYDLLPGKINPYGYVFFEDGSFQYKDTVTNKEDKGDDQGFLSCKGTWKVQDDYIYVKVDEFKEKILGNDYKEQIKTKALESAYIKVGELSKYETDDDKQPYKVDLYPILSCYAQQDNIRPFYYSKKDSEKLKNIDFYNVEKNTSGMQWNYLDYLTSFFEGDKYKVQVYTEYEQPLFLARSFIDEKKNIAKRGVVFNLNNGFIDVLITLDKEYITDANNILYKVPNISNSYWKIDITHHELIDAPFVTVKVISPFDKSVIDTKYFEFNAISDFVLCDNDEKGKPISAYKAVDNPITNEVIPLPLGTDGSHGKDAQYVLFGNWPQSVKNKYVTVSDKVEKYNGFDAYKGSDGYYYVKPKENHSYMYKYSTGEIVRHDTQYYFKIEPIKWCVLDNNYYGGKLLFSEIPIDVLYFEENEDRIINFKKIVPNNYKYSKLRAYINSLDGSSYGEEDFSSSGFLNRAFSKEAQYKIRTVRVDNSVASQKDALNKVKKLNKYYCEDTKDKVFILSTSEMTNKKWGFSEDIKVRDKNRLIRITDYASTMGLSNYDKLMTVDYFVRSPKIKNRWKDKEDATINIVRCIGTLDDAIWVIRYDEGIVPAIVVDWDNGK